MASAKIGIAKRLERVTAAITNAAGSNIALVLALLLILSWLAFGSIVHYSEKWEVIISTISSVITILMVFVLQKSHNKDSLAIQLKLNELVASHELASNRLVNVEGMTEEELKVIQKYYLKLSEFTGRQQTLTQSHSIDEVHEEHAIKKEMEQELRDIGKE